MDLTQFESQYDHISTDVPALKRAIANKLMYQIGKDPVSARAEDWMHAAAYAVRDGLVERWMKTTRAQYAQDVKRVYYLSMEFLIGRTFGNAVLALELMPTLKQALKELEVDVDGLFNLEPDAALGNGGLGRLAACFLDAMATLAVPGFGYGIRYDYGMFRQQIIDGRQVEAPDYWLTHGNPWSFRAPRPPTGCASAAGWRKWAAGRPRWCAGSTPTTCWPWPTTPSSRVMAPRPPTPCACGAPRPPKR